MDTIPPQVPPERPSPPEPERPRRSRFALTEPAATSALLMLACLCAGLLLALPRALGPAELPALTLPEEPVRRVIAADARDARSAPSTPLAKTLEAQWLAYGRAEIAGPEQREANRQRRALLGADYAALAAEVSAPAALKLRAKAVQQLEAALALELAQDEARAVLGAFPGVLARENASRDGEIVAPPFVVRTLYKARWNILHKLAPSHAFEPVEKRAFFGWEALHAERVTTEQRLEALQAYAEAGGSQVEEARGVLLFRSGSIAEARKSLEKAYAARPTLRTRNLLLGAEIAAKSPN